MNDANLDASYQSEGQCHVVTQEAQKDKKEMASNCFHSLYLQYINSDYYRPFLGLGQMH